MTSLLYFTLTKNTRHMSGHKLLKILSGLLRTLLLIKYYHTCRELHEAFLSMKIPRPLRLSSRPSSTPSKQIIEPLNTSLEVTENANQISNYCIIESLSTNSCHSTI